MRQILLVCVVMLLGCQRLRLEVDDLKLRCGNDANLVDVAQWIEPFSNFGKPTSSSIYAAVIYRDLRMEKLPISSKGCVAIPADKIDWQWLSVRSEEGGVFGKVLKVSPERYRRVQLEPIGNSSPRFDCPVSSVVKTLPVKVTFLDHTNRDHMLLNMELVEVKNSSNIIIQLDMSQESGDAISFDLTSVQEGAYQAKIGFIDLLNIQNNLKSFERSCLLRVDRSPPKVKMLLRSGGHAANLENIRLGPGEALEIKAEDATQTHILSCWIEKTTGSCANYVEAGSRLSAPSEGEWILEYYAVDDAGNTSERMKHEVSIFDADRVGRIVGWIDEARLYLKQETYFEAAQRIYQAAWTMVGLKTKAERQYVQEKFRLPFFSLLVKNVPLNRFRSDDGFVLDLWGVSASTFLVHIDGERRLGQILKLHDLSGKVLKKLNFEDKSVIRFSWSSKKVLVWQPNGQLQLYNDQLLLETSFSLSKDDKSEILDFKGHQALISSDNVLYHVDLARPEARVIENVQSRIPTAALSLTGKWLVYQTADGLMIQDLEKGGMNSKIYGSTVEDVKFASFADTMCVKLKSEIKCGEPQKILQNDYVLEGSDATGAFAIEPYAKFIGYSGHKKVYNYDVNLNQLYSKPYLKSVFSLYFLREALMLESTDGALSWTGLPLDAGEQKPFDPDQRPKILRTVTDNDQIFYNDFIGYGLFNITLRAFGKAPVQLRYPLRASAFNLQKMAVLPDQSHWVALDNEKHINIYETDKSLFQAYTLDCLVISPDGRYCLFLKDSQMHYGEFAPGSTTKYAFLGAMPNVSPYAKAVWNPFLGHKVAFFHEKHISIFEFKNGTPRLVFQTEYGKSTWQVKWLTAQYLAISDGASDIEVWDIERHTKIFVYSDRRDVGSMFHIPIDYSPVLNTFVIVGKDEDKSPVMEAWQVSDKEAKDSYAFTESDMEYAQIVKFMTNSQLLMVGFHHGHVYVVKDFSKPLKRGNVFPLQEHQDIIADIGFLNDGKIAYSISEDGSITTHKLQGDFSSEEIVKSDYATAGGWLESDQVFWVQYNNNSTVFYDVNGRVVDRADAGLSFVGELVSIDLGGKALFNWRNFDVWQNLCRWSPVLARKAMEDLERVWTTCDDR